MESGANIPTKGDMEVVSGATYLELLCHVDRDLKWLGAMTPQRLGFKRCILVDFIGGVWLMYVV